MGCWLIITIDCTRPCDCSSQHPLSLASNPGIGEGDGVIIADWEYKIPCCMAVVKAISVRENKTFVYLMNCSGLNTLGEDIMGKVMKMIRTLDFMGIIDISQDIPCPWDFGGPGGI